MSKSWCNWKIPQIPTQRNSKKNEKSNEDLLNADDTFLNSIVLPDHENRNKAKWLSKPKNQTTQTSEKFVKKRKSDENYSVPGVSKVVRFDGEVYENDRSSSEHGDMERQTSNESSENEVSASLDLNESIFLDMLETQCLKDIEAAEKSATKSITTCWDVGDTQLNELFNNDLEVLQSSQRFLADLREVEGEIILSQTQVLQKPSDNEHFITITNNGSEYIQKQREMCEINSENLNEALDDPNLSQIFKSSQYLREIEEEFNNYEKSICAGPSSNSNDMDQNQLETIVLDDDLHNINWDSPVRPKNVPGRSSTLVRQKLNEVREKVFGNSPVPYKMHPVSSSKFSDLGPFFGLPVKVKSLIKEFKGIDNLYDWQKECLNLPAISNRNNLIYALPTSGGKTLVAEILLLREILCRRKNVIFILPYVSIVQEKVWSLSPFAVALNFLVETYAAGKGKCPPLKRRNKKSVFVCTIEKSLSLIDSLIEANRLEEFGLIVVDELHLLGESGRGSILEMALTKPIFVKSDIQIVGMSATIGNLNEVAKFLNADIYTRDFRPVELQEYIKCGSDILKINSKAPTIEENFIFHRTIDYDYSSELLKQDRDHIAGLVMEVIPEESCLIFCSSKKSCESLAINLCKIFGGKYLEHRKEEKNELMKAIVQDTASPLCTTLKSTIPYGISYHHSGLTLDERKHLEEAFRLGILCVICCTSTLAAGVNLPAKRVIIRTPYVGNQFLTLSRYKQMVGRAGRAGMVGDGTGESYIICQPRDNQKIATLLCSHMDQAMSNLLDMDNRGVRCLILSAISLKIADKRPDIRNLLSKTLLAVQAERLNIQLNEIADQEIGVLFRKKALQKRNFKNMLKAKSVEVKMLETQHGEPVETQKVLDKGNRVQVFISNSIAFEISKLGKASVRACLDLERANLLYKDIIEAQKSLVLSDYLHLLYVVVPIEKTIDIRPDMTLYYSLYSKLNPNQQLTARRLGISESCAIKMATGKPFKPEMEIILRRFFIALLLQDLWDHKSIYEVSRKYDIDRGVVQQIMSLVATNSSSIIRFCEELDEFWAMKELLTCICKRLTHFCTKELLPLMELPAVKIGRARQLYNAGYKSLQAVATASSKELVDKIEHLNFRVAKQLIAAAKLLLLERVETLREEVQDVLDDLKQPAI